MAAFTRSSKRPLSFILLVAIVVSVVTMSFLSGSASAQGKTGQVTVFWGRHKDEGSLREACDSGKYSMVIMSFLDEYGGGKYNLDISGHPVAGMGDAIKRCQFLGVPVSISIGGFGAGYSLPTNRSALALFDHLWNTYFGGNLNDTTGRPFGDAWLDGVDMFLEHGTPAERYSVLALELAKHNIRAGDGKLLHLTATPHCRFPDGRVKEALDTGIFERIHVRFYDDHPDCDGFNAEQWGKWTAAYPFTKIYVGLPASPQAAKTGYTDPVTLRNTVLPVAQRAANYGGVMLWDRYFDKRSNYSGKIKNWV